MGFEFGSAADAMTDPVAAGQELMAVVDVADLPAIASTIASIAFRLGIVGIKNLVSTNYIEFGGGFS